LVKGDSPTIKSSKQSKNAMQKPLPKDVAVNGISVSFAGVLLLSATKNVVVPDDSSRNNEAPGPYRGFVLLQHLRCKKPQGVLAAFYILLQK